MNGLIDEMNDALDEKVNININELKIGDYVNYTYDFAEDYALSKTYSGASSDQIIPQTAGVKWRILNIDEATGTIDLISKNPTGKEVRFDGILGYNNGPYLMNKICEAQYSNSSLNVKARSINLVDVEKHLTPEGIKARKEYSGSKVKYGTTRTYTNNVKYPSLYAKQIGAGVNVTEANASSIFQPDTSKSDPYQESKKIAETEPTTDNTSGTTSSLTVTQTYYGIPIDVTNFGTAGDILVYRLSEYLSESYWVASRFVDTIPSEWGQEADTVYFGLRNIAWGTSGRGMYTLSGYESTGQYRTSSYCFSEI